MNLTNIFVKKKNRKEICFVIAIFSLIILSLSLRIIGLGKGIWLDEYYSIEIIGSNNFFNTIVNIDHPPLYFIFLKLWSLVSLNVEWLRILSLGFSLGIILIVILWLNSVSNYAAIISGLLCSSLPIMLRYGQEIRGYSLLLFGTALAFYSASNIEKKPKLKSWYILFTISLLVVLTTHAVGVFIFFSIGFYILINLKNYSNPAIKKLLISTFIAFLLYLPVFLFIIKLQALEKSLETWWIPYPSIDLVMNTFRILFGLDGRLYIIFVIIIASAFIFSKEKIKSLKFLLTAFFYWITVIMYSLIILPIFWYRTLLPGMIPFIAFIAISISSVKIKVLKVSYTFFIIFLCVLFMFKWVIVDASIPMENWIGVAEYINKNKKIGDIIIVCPDYVAGVFNYYAKLEKNDIKKVNLEYDNNAIKQKILDFFYTKLKSSGYAIYLIVRMDQNVQRNNAALSFVKNSLNKNYKIQVIVKDFGIIKVLKWTCLIPAQ